MSKPTTAAMERYDAMNREAAHVILADANSTTFQLAWARAFLRRIGEDRESGQGSLNFEDKATESRDL